ncbi:LysM peptidoglycan-binding domain-containing protein [bacterium]|nr:LysM peptidoglycan-binding domain-containing protein [bacterium]
MLDARRFRCYILTRFIAVHPALGGRIVKGNHWPLAALVLALCVLSACTSSDRMMLIQHNQESLDSDLSKTQARLAQLDRDKAQMEARLEELGQRLSALESNLDAQRKDQARLLERLGQVEVTVRENLKSSQAQMKESLDKSFVEARTQSESDLRALSADVQRLSANQEALVGQLNKRLEAMQKDLQRFDREIEKVYTEVPKMLERAVGGGASAPAASGGKTYTVQPGDTLSGIARDHGVTVEALREVNGMTPGSVLQAGRELKIP